MFSVNQKQVYSNFRPKNPCGEKVATNDEKLQLNYHFFAKSCPKNPPHKFLAHDQNWGVGKRAGPDIIIKRTLKKQYGKKYTRHENIGPNSNSKK